MIYLHLKILIQEYALGQGLQPMVHEAILLAASRLPSVASLGSLLLAADACVPQGG